MQNNSISNKRPIECYCEDTNKKPRTGSHHRLEKTRPFAIPRLPFTSGRVGILYAKATALPAEIWAKVMEHVLNTSVIDFLNLSQCTKMIRAIAHSDQCDTLFFEALLREKPIVIQAYASRYLKTVDVIASLFKHQFVSLPKNLFYLNFPEQSPKGIPAKIRKSIGERRGEVKILELALPFYKSPRLKFFQNVERLILNFNGERFSHVQLQSLLLGERAPKLKILHIKNAIVGDEHLFHVGFQRLLGCHIPDTRMDQKLTLEKLVFEDCRIGQAGLSALMETSLQSSIEMFSKFEEKKMIRLFPSRSFYHNDFEQEIKCVATYGTFSVENMRELDCTAIDEIDKPDRKFGILPIFHAKREVGPEYESLLNDTVFQGEPERLAPRLLAAVKRYYYSGSYPKLEVLHLRKNQLLPVGIQLQTLIAEFQRFRAVAPNLARFIIHSGTELLECDASEEGLAKIFGQLAT